MNLSENQTPVLANSSVEALVTPEDHDAGFKDVALEYRRGAPRDGDPRSIRIVKASRRAAPAILAGMRAEIGQRDRDFLLPATLACLPAGLNSEHFLDTLTIECSTRIEAIAFILTFGEPGQKKLAALTQAIETNVRAQIAIREQAT